MGNGDGRRQRRSTKESELEAAATGHVFTTEGAQAASHWLQALELPAIPRWYAEVAVLADGDTRFDLNIYPEEWGFCFSHDSRASWIRVTDVPFVHGRDDFQILAKTPSLLAINALLTELEHAHRVAFRRATASVRTNLPNAPPLVRDWLLQPLSTVKKTVELCGCELHAGIRCARAKGHEGDHEYIGPDAAGQLRWK